MKIETPEELAVVNDLLWEAGLAISRVMIEPGVLSRQALSSFCELAEHLIEVFYDGVADQGILLDDE